MARPSETACTRETFVGEPCYTRLTLIERASLMVYLKALELEALGGTDYTDPAVLNEAIACINTLGADQQAVAELVIQAGNAEDAGAVIPDTDGIPAAIACFKNYTLAQLNSMELLLDCQLGRHAAYPQSDL